MVGDNKATKKGPKVAGMEFQTFPTLHILQLSFKEGESANEKREAILWINMQGY